MQVNALILHAYIWLKKNYNSVKENCYGNSHYGVKCPDWGSLYIMHLHLKKWEENKSF